MRDIKSVQKVEELHPKIREEVKQLINKAEQELGEEFAIRVAQGLRTIPYQDSLYNQPWDKKDNDGDGKIDEKDEKVTSAKGGSSYHNYGLAIDFCILFKNKITGVYEYDKIKSWAVNANWMKVVKIFKNAGYVWGGDWTPKKRDFPHFEKNFGVHWRTLLNRYSKKDFIKGTTYINI